MKKKRKKYQRKGLINTWLLATGTGNKAESLRLLNKDLRTNYKQGRMYDWINGNLRPATTVINYMITKSLAYAIDHSEDIADMAKMLSLPSKIKPAEKENQQASDLMEKIKRDLASLEEPSVSKKTSEAA